MGVVWFLGYLVSPVVLVVLGFLPIRRASAVAGAALNLIFVAGISAAVFSEDSYVGNGSSSWSNRGAGPHAIYAGAMAAALAVGGFFTIVAARKVSPSRLRPALRVSGIGDLIVGYVVLFAFDNN